MGSQALPLPVRSLKIVEVARCMPAVPLKFTAVPAKPGAKEALAPTESKAGPPVASPRLWLSKL